MNWYEQSAPESGDDQWYDDDDTVSFRPVAPPPPPTQALPPPMAQSQTPESASDFRYVQPRPGDRNNHSYDSAPSQQELRYVEQRNDSGLVAASSTEGARGLEQLVSFLLLIASVPVLAGFLKSPLLIRRFFEFGARTAGLGSLLLVVGATGSAMIARTYLASGRTMSLSIQQSVVGTMMVGHLLVRYDAAFNVGIFYNRQRVDIVASFAPRYMEYWDSIWFGLVVACLFLGHGAKSVFRTKATGDLGQRMGVSPRAKWAVWLVLPCGVLSFLTAIPAWIVAANELRDVRHGLSNSDSERWALAARRAAIFWCIISVATLVYIFYIASRISSQLDDVYGGY